MHKKWSAGFSPLAMMGLVFFMLPACGQKAPEEITAPPAQVELDIFSGVPNPTWALTLPETEDLMSRIARLDPIEEGRQRAENLGYRGFIVQIGAAGSATGQAILAARGIIEVTGSTGTVYYLDPQRQIELWLLATARPPLGDDLTGQIVKGINQDGP